MSLSNQIPEGLKSHNVEHGNGSFRPPIPYVPERLDYLDPDRKVPTIKIELSNGVESRQPVWDGHGSPENFLCHMQGMREALEDMGLFAKYEEARQKVSRGKEQVQEQKDLSDVVLEQIENTVLEADNEAIKEFNAAVAAAKQDKVAAMATIFSTTANFFRGDSKTPWDNIVHEQTEKDPWTNLRGGSSPGSAARQWQPGTTATRSCSRRCSQTMQQNNKNSILPCFASTPVR
jgi:hypothetical protein